MNEFSDLGNPDLYLSGAPHDLFTRLRREDSRARESAWKRELVDVEDTAIRVDGRPRALRAGMGGSARIVIGRRALLGYAFDPIRQLRESLAPGPAG